MSAVLAVLWKRKKTAAKTQMYFQQKRKCKIDKNATCNSKSATSSVSLIHRIKTHSTKAPSDIKRTECSRAGRHSSDGMVDIVSLVNAVPTSSEGNNDSPKNNTNHLEIAEFLSSLRFRKTFILRFQ